MNAWPALLALWATALATSPAQAVDGTARLCAAYAGKPAAASAELDHGLRAAQPLPVRGDAGGIGLV
mgnify:CR=1 FL=1